MTMIIEWLKAVLYGIVEGVTEWLPISSTGHLILLEEWLPFRFAADDAFMSEFWEMFQVVIQLGAILAVVLLFWIRLWPFSFKKTSREERRSIWTLWFKIALASVPAALIGIVGDKILEELTGKDINGWVGHYTVVAAALVVYGVAFIVIERRRKGEVCAVDRVEDISYSKAFWIGCFQALSILPGTSRSGSTILGSMLLGLSRTAGAEFSFFMAIPAMAGGSSVKLLGFFSWVGDTGVRVPAQAWVVLAIGFVVAFFVSLAVIRFLMDFVKKHSFASFGVYRIVLGAIILLYWVLTR